MSRRRLELCRDLVGKRVRLLRDIETRGGVRFTTGEVLHVEHTWRGCFDLTERDAQGTYVQPRRYVSKIRRIDFELVE